MARVSPATPSATAASRAGAVAFLRERWDFVALVALAIAPLVVPALGGALGGQVTTLFIYCILALGLNVMVGYTGLVHLGIAAFFGIGAYLFAILTVPMYPFQMRFVTAAAVSALAVNAMRAAGRAIVRPPSGRPPWPAREKSAGASAASATCPRSRGPWKWSPRRKCARRSSACWPAAPTRSG